MSAWDSYRRRIGESRRTGEELGDWGLVPSESKVPSRIKEQFSSGDKPPVDLAHAGWYDGFLFSPALTIGGGTGEVQRNIVGELVLGLPREVDVQAGLSWAEAQRAGGPAS